MAEEKKDEITAIEITEEYMRGRQIGRAHV